MEIHNKDISTPSGFYSDNIINYQEKVYPTISASGPNPIINNTYYVKGVGVVYNNNGRVNSNDTWEKELVRYHVQ